MPASQFFAQAGQREGDVLVDRLCAEAQPDLTLADMRSFAEVATGV